MSRNTHDSVLDHHNLDDLVTELIDNQGLVDALEAEGISGGGGYVDLLTGDDADFTSSLGNWTNSGGTMTRDTTYKIAEQAASLKFSTTATSNYVEVAVSGTFTAGSHYFGILWLSIEQVSGALNQWVELGDIGAGDTERTPFNIGTTDTFWPWIGNSRFVPVGVFWTPSADRTAVKLRWTRVTASSTYIPHIGAARVVQAPTIPLFIQPGSDYGAVSVPIVGRNDTASNSVRLGPWTNGGGIYFYDWGEIDLDSSDYLSGLYMFMDGSLGDAGQVYSYAEHPAGDLVTIGGHLWQTGEDYLGIYLHQKDASTLQYFADDDHDIEHADSATKGFVFRSDDDAVAWPAKGMLPQYSAAPGSPVEGQGYYDTTLHKSRTWDGSAWQNHW